MNVRTAIPIGVGMLAAIAAAAQAQPEHEKSLAATMNVSVFPSEGQAPDQQSKDEASQQLEQQSQQAQQATAEQIDNFKKAFSVCLEGNKYLVKY